MRSLWTNETEEKSKEEKEEIIFAGVDILMYLPLRF